jgi:ABC-type multidrug transport system fused ATPase/permease subunit
VGAVLAWVLALVLTTLIINYLNFIIESFSSETELSFLPIILITGGLFAIDYFELLSFKNLIGSAFNAIYQSPLLIGILVLILVALFVLNSKLLHKKLFLDSGLKTQVKEVNASNLEWTKNFGDIAPFMQLDLRLIWRNKRTKSSVWMLALGLLYGLFFYPNPTYNNMPFFFIFIGIFSTGIFLINFGQFVPAWDSGYYKLLMSQNIKYEQYLKSKFTLMALSVVILFVLGIPYVYFGWKILLAHFAAAIYNIGINTHVILWGGAFNRKKIDLSQKAAFNYQGTGAVQWLIGIPLLVLPMIIFALLNWLLSFEIACLVLIVMGVVGIVFHQKLMRFITGKYLESKYKMIDAFNQDN